MWILVYLLDQVRLSFLDQNKTHVKKHLSHGIGDRKYKREYITLKKMAAIE